MRQPHRTALVLAGVSAIVASLVPPAFATSVAPETPYCPMLFVPRIGVPANTPAFAVAAGPVGDLRILGMTPAEGTTFSLLPDPASPRTTLILPSQPLEAGVHYEISLGYTCSNSGASEGQSVTFAVDTLRNVPLPKQQGTLVADEPAHGHARVMLSPTAEMAAFLPAARFEIVVHGTAWQEVPYGEAVVAPPTVIDGGKVAFEISRHGGPRLDSSLCATDEIGIKRFQVELRAHIAGASSDPEPVSLDGVPMDCTRPAFQAQESGAPAKDGCTAAPSRAGLAPGVLALACAAVTLAKRRGTRARRTNDRASG